MSRTVFVGGSFEVHDDRVRIMLTGQEGEVAADIRRRGRIVQKRAQRRVARERYATGELYHSISVSTKYPLRPGPIATITAEADHGMVIEFGRGRIEPVDRKALNWQGGEGPVFSMSAKPVEAVPYLREALDAFDE